MSQNTTSLVSQMAGGANTLLSGLGGTSSGGYNSIMTTSTIPTSHTLADGIYSGISSGNTYSAANVSPLPVRAMTTMPPLCQVNKKSVC